MKWFSIILSLYFITLLCIPCHDSINVHVDNENALESAAHDHTEHQDTCSPFCTCSCCGISVSIAALPNYSNTSVAKPNSVEKIIFENTNLITQYLESIWQPPKV